MRIKSIALRNFQIHEKLEVLFSPKITTIRGGTDQGKSSILRALRWIALNDFAGDAFIREGAQSTSVVLRTDEGEIERRRKKGTDNTYLFNGEEFRAFGQGVPKDIAEALSLSGINFQGQHDAPFWFCETSGEVSRRLNSIIDLSIIDTTLANIAHEVRRSQERKSLCADRLKQAKENLELNEAQRPRIAEFQRLQSIKKGLRLLEISFERLNDILTSVSNNDVDRLSQKAEEGEALLVIAKRMIGLARRQSSLQEIIEGVGRLSKNASPPPNFQEVEEQYAQWSECKMVFEKLGRMVCRIHESMMAVDALREASIAAEKRFHEETKGMICPLCGNPV